MAEEEDDLPSSVWEDDDGEPISDPNRIVDLETRDKDSNFRQAVRDLKLNGDEQELYRGHLYQLHGGTMEDAPSGPKYADQSFDDTPSGQQRYDAMREYMDRDTRAYTRDHTTPEDPGEGPDSGTLGTLARGAVRGAGGAAGALAGVAAGAPAGAALGSVVPGIGTAIGTVGGALVGGIAGGLGGDFTWQAIRDKLGLGDDPAQVAADQEAHPYIKAAGETLPYAATMGVGAVPTIARIAGAGIMGGIDVAQQAYQKGAANIDLTEAAIRAAPGALGGFNATAMRAGKPIAEAVGKAAGLSGEQIGETVAGITANAGRPAAKAAESPEAQTSADTTPPTPKAQGTAAEEAPTLPGDPTEGGSSYQVVRDGPGPQSALKDAPESGRAAPFVESDAAVDAALSEQLGTKPVPRGAPAEGGAPGEPIPQAPNQAAETPPEQLSRAGPAVPKMTIGDQLKAAQRERLQAQMRQQDEVVRSPPVEKPPEEPPITQQQQQQQPAAPPPEQPPAELIKKGQPLTEAKGMAAEAPARYTEAAQGLQATAQRLVMPGSMSEAGREASTIKRAAQGSAEQKYQQRLAQITNDLHIAMNQKTSDEQRMLVNRAQGGDAFPDYKPTAKDQQIIDTLHKNYADVKDEISKMPEHEQQQFWDSNKYLPGMYKDPEKASKFFQGWFGKGGRGFTKEKTFPTEEEARAAGLEPVSSNPFFQHAKYMENIKHYTATTNMIRALRESDMLKYTTPENAPRNWDRLEAFADANGRGAYAPRDAAAVVNNFYGTGLRNAATKDFYDLARRAQNTYTMAELGLSPYHAMTEVGESISSGFARAITRFASGDLKGAAESFAKAPINPYLQIKEGARLRKEFVKDPSQWSAADRPVLEAMTKSNIKPVGIQHAPDYEMAKGGSFVDTWLKGSFKKETEAAMKDIWGDKNVGAGIMYIPRMAGRLLQTVAHPIFQYMVPNLKMAAHAELIRDYIKANPAASPKDLQMAANRIGDTIDNRMGEMVKDNLTMRAGLSHAAYLAMRSFSWTIGGAVREIGGGTLAAGRAALKGQNAFDMRSAAYDPRAAYAPAFAFTVAMMSGIYQMMKTGQPPSEWRDFMYPKTGGKVTSAGKQVDERVLMPGYHKDIMGYLFHPKQEISGKVAGLWSQLGDQISGKDWKGDPIVNTNAPYTTQLQQRLAHLTTGLTPISAKSIQQGQKKGTNISSAETALGLRSPGAYIQNPEGSAKGAATAMDRAWKIKTAKEKKAQSAYGR